MGDRIDKPLRGLGIMSALDFGSLLPDGAGSVFAARDPGPGNASTVDTGTRLEPATSGGQTAAVELAIRRGGMPERGGAEALWRFASESADPYALRGWSPPNLQTQWIAAKFDAVDNWASFSLVVTPDDQQLIAIYARSNDPADPIRSKRFDFAAADWGPEVIASVNPYDDTGSDDSIGTDALALVALPGGRILALGVGGSVPSVGQYNVYASDDRGDSWFRYAAPVITTGGTPGAPARLSMQYVRGDLVLFSQGGGLGTGDDNIGQLSSRSLGTTWEFLTGADDIGTSMSSAVLPANAGVLLCYIRASDSLPVARILASAFDPFTDAAEVEIDSIEVDSMSASVDAIGNVWIHARLANDRNVIAVWLSEDSGATFGRLDENLFDTRDPGLFIGQLSGVFCRGWLVLGHSWTAPVSTATNSGFGTLWAAGWSSFGSNAPVLDGGYVERTSWAGTSAAGVGEIGISGIPIELPQNAGWSLTGTGVPTLEDPGELELSSDGANQITLSYTLSANTRGQVWRMSTKVLSGGSDLVAAVRWDVTRSNGANTWTLGFRFDAANGRVRVIDGGFGSGTIIAEILMDPSDWVDIIAFVNLGGEYLVLYKRPWQTKWARGPSNFLTGLTDLGPSTAGNRGRMHHDATVAVSRWRQWLGRETDIDQSGFGFGWALLEDNNGGLHAGGNITTLPRPIPEAGSEAAAAFLVAQRGPGREGEVYTVDPVYQFGIDRMFATVSPSSAEPFRTVDTATEVQIAFSVMDGAEDSALGAVWQWLFGFMNCNVKTIIVERRGHNIVPWSTVGTYNAAAGFEGLAYSRVGKWIRPAAGSIAAGRVLRRNELAGGFAILGAGVARRIVGNSAGGWVDPATGSTVFPEVQVEGIDGTEPASGFCDLVFADGVLSVAHTGAQPLSYSKYWRVRIPVQDTPDTYYQVGNFVPATVAVFGKQWSRGWSRDMRPNTSRRTSRAGTIRKRQQGRPARRWSMGWADGVNEGKTRGSVNGDYLAQAGGGTPLALQDDVWTMLYGLLEETGGGAVPVLAIASVPPGTASINDRTLFLYGTWDSSVQANQVTGDEGIREFLRIDPISVSELV